MRQSELIHVRYVAGPCDYCATQLDSTLHVQKEGQGTKRVCKTCLDRLLSSYGGVMASNFSRSVPVGTEGV